MGIGVIPWMATHAILFLLLLYLIKKYLWGPVTALLDERGKAIEDQFAEVERLKQEAAGMREDYKTKLQEAQAEARETVKKAQEDAVRAAEQLKAETQTQLEKARKEAQNQISHETEMAKADLRKYVADLSVLAAEKFLTEGLSENQRKSLIESTLPEVERTISNN